LIPFSRPTETQNKIRKENMKASTVLKKARKVLKTKGWTKGELARNKWRHKVDPTNPNAVRFCAYGAIYHVLGVKDTDFGTKEYDHSEHIKVNRVSRYLSATTPLNDMGWQTGVDTFNDRDATKFEDVDAWFKRAIRLAEKDDVEV
jgi:hypothetical protein